MPAEQHKAFQNHEISIGKCNWRFEVVIQIIQVFKMHLCLMD